MILTLHYVEYLRSFVVSSIRATDRLRSGRGRTIRLPEGTKRLYKKAWEILVDEQVLTAEESDEIQVLVDYRNVVAHATENVTVDLNRNWRSTSEESNYKPRALTRIVELTEIIESRMASRFVISLSPQRAIFEPAEKTYYEELLRLGSKIDRQTLELRAELDAVNKNIAALPKRLLDELDPAHPRNRKRNGTLSRDGINCCYSLFQAGSTPLTVAYLMRITLRASKARYNKWQTQEQRRRTRDDA